MNKIFKVIYSKTRHCYVVVSELAKKHGKKEKSEYTTGKKKYSRKQLTMALALTLALGGSTSVWAEQIQTDVITGQQLTQGEWSLERPAFVRESTITTDKVTLKDKAFPASADWNYNSPEDNWSENSPLVLGKEAVLKAKNGIIIDQIELGGNDKVNLAGLYVGGGRAETPTLEISHIGTTEDNKISRLWGLNTNTTLPPLPDAKVYYPELQADTIHIHDISSNQTQIVAGAGLAVVKWNPLTQGTDNNLYIENIHNTSSAENPLAFGLIAVMTNDYPLTITGQTELKHITSENGSAVGMTMEHASDFKNTVGFHQLDISDIHGKDLSIGLYGGAGTVYAENADINMTGKEHEYAGLYTAFPDEGGKAKVSEFAIEGPYIGNINLNNPNGNYTIYGNVLADQMNHGQLIQAQYQLFKDMLKQEGLSEEEREEIQKTLDAYPSVLADLHNYGQINLAGHLQLYGDVYAKNGGTLNLHLQNGSYFEGQADDYADCDSAGQLTPRKVDLNEDIYQSSLGKFYPWKDIADEAYAYGVPYLTAGTINLTMDPGSQWQARGKSFISSLDFNQGGLVDTRKTQGGSVTVGKLTGAGGTFLMDFSKDAAKSDMLYVKDLSQSGVQHIQAYLQPDTKVEELKGVRFATTGGDDYKRDPAAKFDVSLAKDQGINNVTLKVKNEKFNPEDTAANEKFNGGKNGMGTYKPGNDYVTATFSGKGFTKEVPNQEKIMTDAMAGKQTTDDAGNLLPEYLKTETIENPVKEGTNWFVDEAVVTPSDSGKVIKKAIHLDYMNAIYGVYTDSLEKRLGEARYSGDGDGMWARIRHDRVGRDSLYEANNTMTELGFDWRNDRTKFGRHIQGAALDYMDGSADYKEVTGRSDSKRYGLWFYDTRLGDKGHYTDIVAKYGRLQNEYTLYPEMGGPVKGDYHDDYWSLSFEYGRKKPLASNWFIEPQAQLQYTYLGSTDYRTSQGTQVDLAGTDSLISRLGFRLGKDVSDRTSFYITGDFFHEFLGNQDVSAWDRTGRMDVTGHNDGSWYNAGLGFTTRVGKNSYAYASFDRSFGPHVDRTWTLEAGVNFRF